MKRIIPVLLFWVLLTLIPANINGQCKIFAKRVCKVELGSFMHDGNYHAAILEEGEEAELYKTFYAGQDYRLAICGDDNLYKIEFTVMDTERNELYNNSDNDFNATWDFSPVNSEQLLISVKVLPSENNGADNSGCVAIMFGFTEK